VIAVVLLYLLATLDAAMSGYRAAGGRNALICKRPYQARAQFLAVLWGQAFIAAIAAVIALLLAVAGDPPALADDLLEACRRLMVVYLPYASVFVAAVVLLAVPSVDCRSILNVLVFGPFTLLRPIVGLVGVAWAFVGVPRWQVLVIGLFGIAAMLALEWWLNGLYARQPQR
jgi:hypothetical protein